MKDKEEKFRRKNHEQSITVERGSKLSNKLVEKEKEAAKKMIDSCDEFALLYINDKTNGCISIIDNPIRMFRCLKKLAEKLKETIKKAFDYDD